MEDWLLTLGLRLRRLGFSYLPIVIVLCLLGAGCATNKSTVSSTDLAEIPKGPLATHKKFVIFPLNFSVYETSAGEVTEKMPDWSKQAKRHLRRALLNEIQSHSGLSAEFLQVESLSEKQKDHVRDLQALFVAVGQSVGQHVKGMGDAQFSERSFQDYTLGSDIGELAPQADAIVFLAGLDQISSGGRITRQIATTILLAVLGVVAVPASGVTAGSIGVVDVDTGDLLWLNNLARRGGIDTREMEGASALIKQLTQEFPWP